MEFQALKDVSFDVARGSITAVVGESGSGKSVTALSILKLLPSPPAFYENGQIIFDEDGEPRDLLKLSYDELRQLRGNRISMIFQEPMTSLNPLKKCGEQVAESLRLHKGVSGDVALQQTEELFKKVRLPDPGGMLHRYPHQLSGGQKQRVMIAMALCCRPALMIADEPTTALDVTVQKNILELIRELQQELRMGVIFITHDLGLVKAIADRVVVMYKGSVVEQGDVVQVLENPRHVYTRALLACRPVLHPPGTRLPSVVDLMDAGSRVEDTGLRVVAAGQSHTNPQHPSSNPVLVKVRDLEVRFPGKKSFLGKPLSYTKAVDGVSFDIHEGETLGLVGESGCGKTTLGRALLRLTDIHSGSIHYKGQDLVHMPGAQLKQLRKDVQIVFQDPYSSLNPRMTIGDAIHEAMQVHSIGGGNSDRKERAVNLLEKVGLRADQYNRYPHEFSGGQRQRIGIARALALNPGFLVCDESVSALDVSVQAQVLNLLSDLKKEYGFTILFISHDLSVVRHVSQRIMVMNGGRIEEIGQAEQVFNNPSSSYTRRLVDAIPGSH